MFCSAHLIKSHVVCIWGFPDSSAGRVCLQCRRPWSSSQVGKVPWRKERLPAPVFLGFPGVLDSNESACNAGDLGSIPGLGRSPGGGHDNPLRYSAWRIPMNRGAWRATVHGSQRVRHDWATKQHSHVNVDLSVSFLHCYAGLIYPFPYYTIRVLLEVLIVNITSPPIYSSSSRIAWLFFEFFVSSCRL